MQDLHNAEELLAEYDRRHRERALDRYQPSRIQTKFHDSDAPVRLFVAANGTGKTTCAMAEAAAYCRGYRPWNQTRTHRAPPVKVLVCCRDFKHSLSEDILDKLLVNPGFLPPSSIEKLEKLPDGAVHRIVLKNGSTIKILTYKQYVQDPQSAEGLDYDYAIFNEPPPRGLWIAVSRGTAKKGGRSSFHMTPIGGESAWIYDAFYARDHDHVEVFAATIDDSFMTEEKKREFMAGLDVDEVEARAYGRFRHLVGRVYKAFQPDRHMLGGRAKEAVWRMVRDPKIPKGVVIDPHDRKPFMIGYFLVTPRGRIIFYREWPDGPHHEMKSCEWTVDGYADWMKNIELEDQAMVVWRIGDPNSTQKRNVATGESILDRFMKNGLVFDVAISDKAQEKHTSVKDRLRERTLLITDDCKNLHHGFMVYAWMDRPQDQVLYERPGEMGKDAMDVVAYTCVSGVGYFNPLEGFVGRKPIRRHGGLAW